MTIRRTSGLPVSIPHVNSEDIPMLEKDFVFVVELMIIAILINDTTRDTSSTTVSSNLSTSLNIRMTAKWLHETGINVEGIIVPHLKREEALVDLMINGKDNLSRERDTRIVVISPLQRQHRPHKPDILRDVVLVWDILSDEFERAELAHTQAAVPTFTLFLPESIATDPIIPKPIVDRVW